MYLVGSAGGLEWTPRSRTQQQQRIDRSMDGELANEAMSIGDNDAQR